MEPLPAPAPRPSPRRIAILGSTGSLGRQALEICEHFQDRVQVSVLAATGQRTGLLAAQIARVRPQLVAVQDAAALEALRHRLPSDLVSATAWTAGPGALEEAVSAVETDLVLVVTSGLAGLRPTLTALAAGRRVALANKEVLVAAGALFDPPVAQLVRSGRLLPVDSEHSALWQALWGERPESVEALWLTASGGPFWGWDSARLASVTPRQALEHPNWRMGPKVTVDSATLMNKGFEVIEAHHLFGVPYPQIHVVVHRQSVVHSLVAFRDGSVKAQLSLPDMRLPMLLAISFPERWLTPGWARLPLAEQPLQLGFEPVNPAAGTPAASPLARSLELCRQAATAGGTYPAVLSAADEVAVEEFLEQRLPFTRIWELLARTLEAHRPPARASDRLDLSQVLEADAWARRHAREVAARINEPAT